MGVSPDRVPGEAEESQVGLRALAGAVGSRTEVRHGLPLPPDWRRCPFKSAGRREGGGGGGCVCVCGVEEEEDGGRKGGG